MDAKPYLHLAEPRVVDQLPEDLAGFYALHEGLGLESSSDQIVRLCQLREVARIGWHDLHILGSSDWPGWEEFAGLRIGVSSFFDEIIYVLQAPCCPRGAVLTVGVNIAGPGGTGPAALEFSLVLAPSFADWLRHLEQLSWVEYGLVPGDIAKLPVPEQHELFHYYRNLNPSISWAEERPELPQS